MAKKAAKGIKISYLTGSTYNDIAQLRSLSYDLGGAPDKIDVTTHDQADNYRAYVPGWLNPGSAEIVIMYDPGNSTHAWLRSNGGSTQTLRITLPDAGNATETFSAAIGALRVDGEIDGALQATIPIEILGASTHAA